MKKPILKIPTRIQNALDAMSAVKKKFWYSYPERTEAAAEDGFGNPLGGSHFGRMHVDTGPKPPETPAGFSLATKAGAVAGGMITAGMTVYSVAVFGTTTPVAMFFGGILIAGIGAAGGAFMGPTVAVLTLAPLAGLAALAGIKKPDVKIPGVDLKAAEMKLPALTGRMKTAFQAKAGKVRAYLSDTRKPKPPAP